MKAYSKSADEHHLAIVIPEGINQSFNAGDCCGDAHKLEIHDVEFIYAIKHALDQEFDFVKHEYSYGIGWDSGGLLLSDALIESPHLFKAIVPIAGYSSRTWTPPLIRNGVGIILHHSFDDTKMRPSGCCHNPEMPLCKGSPVKDSCDSVLESFDTWSRTINLCQSMTKRRDSKTDTLNGISESGDRKPLLVGGSDGTFYSLEQENGITSISYVSLADGKEKEPFTELSFSEVPMSVTYQHNDVVCLTTVSASCVTNSTLCLYKEAGHFEEVLSSPDMVDEVMKFLARDACSSNGGSLGATALPDINLCKCKSGTFNGVFCLDLKVEGSLNTEMPMFNGPATTTSTSPLSVVTMIGFVLMATVVTVTLRLMNNRRRLNADDFPASIRNVPLPSMGRMTHEDKLYTIDTNFGHSNLWNNEKQVPMSCKLSEDHASDCDDKSHTSSLDAIDLELLQFYRKKSQGNDAVPIQDISIGDSMGLNLDLELLQSYRRYQQDRRVYGEEREDDRENSIQSSNSRLSCIVHTNLFMDDDIEEAHSLDREAEDGEDSEYAVINSILWDVSMS